MRIIISSLFSGILLLNAPVVYGATTAELQAQIAALLQQVQALQAQLQASSTLSPLSLVREQVVLTFTLRRGSTDAMTNGEVSKLQRFLAENRDIYPEGLVTGYFGVLTEAAVKRFQNQNGIASIGIVGPQTRAAIKRLTIPPAATPTPTTPSSPATSTAPTAPPPAPTTDLGAITFSPSSVAVGDFVTITGSGFMATDNTLNLGSGEIKNLNSFANGTMITLQVPNRIGSSEVAPGTYSVSVTNASGKTASSNLVILSSRSAYPTITAASPNIASVGQTITVSGSGFTLTGNQVHLGVGGVTITSERRVLGTSLTFQIPSSINSCDFSSSSSCAGKTYPVTAGTYSLYITNTNGQTNSVNLIVTAY